MYETPTSAAAACDAVEIGDATYPVKLFDRLITNGTEVDAKLTDHGIILCRIMTAFAAFAAGVAVTRRLLAEQHQHKVDCWIAKQPIIVDGLTVEVETIRRIRCPFCRSCFKFRSGLSRHLHDKHASQLTSSSDEGRVAR